MTTKNEITKTQAMVNPFIFDLIPYEELDMTPEQFKQLDIRFESLNKQVSEYFTDMFNHLDIPMEARPHIITHWLRLMEGCSMTALNLLNDPKKLIEMMFNSTLKGNDNE